VPALTMADPATSNPSDMTSNHMVAPSRSYDPAFAENDANIVLQSSDGVYYRIPAYTLRTTSGFFRGMMTLPVSGKDQGDDGDVIVLDEASEVLGTLFRMIGGLPFERWKSVDELDGILIAAEKYDMPGPIATITINLTTFVFLEQPLKSYAIAARYGMEDAAKFISKYTLSLSIYDEQHIPCLERVSTTYVLRLFLLHRKRREEFQKLITSNKTLGVTNCYSCSDGYEGGALRGIAALGQLMVSNIDLQPAGTDLLNGIWQTWPEASERACNGRSCYVPVTHYQNTITKSIANYIQSLTCTI
jgi:hypothetical protein